MSLELSLYKLDADLTELWAMREDAEERLGQASLACQSSSADPDGDVAAVEALMRDEGVRHSISLRGNGGLAPLTITDAALVPDELQDMRVTMTFAQYLELRRTVWQKYEEGIEVDGPFPSNERIRAALAKRCDHCDGAPAVGTKDECQWCSGTGCAVVPGARLDPRGETVIVK